MDYKICFTTLVILSIYFSKASTNKIFYIGNKKFVNWHKADSECKAKGMNLMSIKTREELEYVREYMKNTYAILFPYWLGAYKVNDQFVWTATGEKITQFFWHAGEPNNSSGQEQCIQTWVDDFDWNDNDCDKEFPYICD